jgi:hypothetical protein
MMPLMRKQNYLEETDRVKRTRRQTMTEYQSTGYKEDSQTAISPQKLSFEIMQLHKTSL